MLQWLRNFFRPPRPRGAGEHGERVAASWLEDTRGFKVVARNWRSPRDRRDEIDLVCRDGDILVFVEVKARAAGALVPGFYAVDARKKRVLRRTIKAYLAHLREKPRTFRLDVVEVSVTAAGPREPAAPLPGATPPATARPEVWHFENVPLFPKHFRA